MSVLEPTSPHTEVSQSNARVALTRISSGEGPSLSSLLAGGRGLTVLTPSPEDLVHTVGHSHDYDVVLLEVDSFQDNETEVFNSIKNLSPDLPIIVVSEALPDSQLRALMKLQPADWLKKPVTLTEIGSAIASAVKHNRSSSNKVHAIVPITGGAGATTIAVALADMLARRQAKGGGSVGLVDLDFSQGNCGLLCNLVNPINLQSVISNPTRIDQQFVQLIQRKHESGFNIYSYKRREIVTHENNYETVLRLLDAVSSQHAHTILDIPVHETDWRNDVLQTVNTVTLVCELNLPSLKQCLDTLEILHQRKSATSSVNLIINKRVSGFFSPQRIKQKQVEELLGQTAVHYLPYEPSTTNEAMDRGQMLSATNSSSKLVKELGKYLDRVVAPKTASK